MKFFLVLFIVLLGSVIFAQNSVNVTIDPYNTHSINPMIYGYNQDHSDPDGEENWGSRRLGGNRMSVFNWENGASNSGHDLATYNNDNRIPNLVGTLWNERNNAGEAYRKFHQDNLDAGITSIITVPIMGWAAADKDGGNTTIPPSSRWVYVKPRKTGAFSLNPDLTDDSVFVDESVNWLVHEFGSSSSATGIKYISLDNEPGLWSATHPFAFPGTINLKDYVDKVIETAKAIKAVDPDVKLIAGEFTGIRIIKFNDASDWDSETTGYPDFPSYFLDKLKQASTDAGINLIDYISFHYYPQHKVDSDNNFSSSGVVIRNSTSSENYIRRERMDLARSLWDENYIEPSWLTGSKLNNEPHKILKRIQLAIDTYFPSVGIMIGEWDFGHDMDIAHGIATADALGVFANENVQIANRWNTSSGNAGNYTSAAYKLFRNYNGNLGTVGDLCLPTSFNSKNKASVWASKSSSDAKTHIIILNKSITSSNEYEIKLGEENLYVESVWGFDESSSTLLERDHNALISSDTLFISTPSLSAYHVVLASGPVSANENKENTSLSLKMINTNQYLLSQPKDWKILSLNGQVVSRGTGTLIRLNALSTGSYVIHVEDSSWKIMK